MDRIACREPQCLYKGDLYLYLTGSFPEIKRPGRGLDHPPPSSAEVKERVELYVYPPLGLRGLFKGELYLLIFCDIRSRYRAETCGRLSAVVWTGTLEACV
jgi:hypothetical protein